MFGGIKRVPEEDHNSYSSPAWLTNIAFNCTKTIVNSYLLVTDTCSKVYQTAKKTTEATVEVVSNVVNASYPVLKALTYCGLSEVIVQGFPEEYLVKVISAGIGGIACAYSFRREFMTKQGLWKSLPNGIAQVVYIPYSALKIRDAVHQWKYPMGYMGNLDSRIYEVLKLVGDCKEAKELSNRVPQYTLRAESSGSADWIGLEKIISLNVKLPLAEKFTALLYALSDATHEEKFKSVLKRLDQGDLAEQEFSTLHDDVTWASQKEAIEVGKKCAPLYNMHMKLKNDFFELDSKHELDEVRPKPSKQRSAEIKELFLERGFRPFCKKHHLHADCVTLPKVYPGRYLENLVRDFKYSTCKRSRSTPKSFTVEFKKADLMQENRIRALQEGSFRLAPEIGKYVAICPKVYKMWKAYDNQMLPEDQSKPMRFEALEVLQKQNKTPTTNDLLQVFSVFIRYVQDQLLEIKKYEIDKERGLSKDDYIDKILRVEWRSEIDYVDANMECMKIINANSGRKYGSVFNERVPERHIFEKFKAFRLAQDKDELESRWEKYGREAYYQLLSPNDIDYIEVKKA